MELNSKRSNSHHLPQLSVSSQVPLIGSDNNGSDRSTPISAHSLPFNSPNKLPINNHHFHNQQQQQSQLNGTPLQPSSAPYNPIFFPPITPNPCNRSNKNVDINMNIEQERNRENLNYSATVLASPRSPIVLGDRRQQFKYPSSDSGSKLNSPLNVSNKQVFAGFFSATNLVTSHSIDANLNHGHSLNADEGWPQQEDYHEYHEPFDPVDDERTHSNPRLAQSSTSNIEKFPLPSQPKSAISINTSSEWPFFKVSNSKEKSPTILPFTDLNILSRLRSSSSSTQIKKVGCNSRQNDISADIYDCYVKLKSTERANQRSRSYHGPKNSTSLAQAQQLLYSRESTKNLSSTSVSDIPMSPRAFAATMQPTQYRDHCVRELLETESNYVHALNMIITCFAKPLENFLKKEEDHLIFGHIKYFHHIHFSFQSDLVKAAFRSYNRDISNLTASKRNSIVNASAQNVNQSRSNPTTPTMINLSHHTSPIVQDVSPLIMSRASSNGHSLRISSCFLHMKEKFLKYGEYCATLSRAQALLDELTNRNDEVSVQLDKCQQNANEGKFKLRDLLSLPMQRVLKYHLLLHQLIKSTNATHDDYTGLKRAHEMMVDLGQYINEVKRDTEAIQIINDIEQSIVGLNMPPNTQLTDYGRLVTDGVIRVKVPYELKTKSTLDTRIKIPNDTKTKQKRYVFVFDKVMLMCKDSGVRRYQYKEALVLSEYQIDTSNIHSQSENTLKHSTKDKWSYSFNLVRSTDQTVYTFYSKTLENRNKWIESIQKAMNNIRPQLFQNREKSHEFLMHTFERATSCDHCGKLLLGLYYQGYRCCVCFTSAHKKCLASIRSCGPTLPPKPNGVTSSINNRKEPPSPSTRSTCSSDIQNVFTQLSSNVPEITDELDKSLPEVNSLLLDEGTDEKDFAHGQCENSYVNFLLNGYPWFCGRMERDQAQSLLESSPHGTFLVRMSPKHNGSYVISLNYNSQVKHMRIYVSKDKLYLSQNRYFNSVTDLVSWYESNSLVESFHMLDAHLAIPFRSIQATQRLE